MTALVASADRPSEFGIPPRHRPSDGPTKRLNAPVSVSVSKYLVFFTVPLGIVCNFFVEYQIKVKVSVISFIDNTFRRKIKSIICKLPFSNLQNNILCDLLNDVSQKNKIFEVDLKNQYTLQFTFKVNFSELLPLQAPTVHFAIN